MWRNAISRLIFVSHREPTNDSKILNNKYEMNYTERPLAFLRSNQTDLAQMALTNILHRWMHWLNNAWQPTNAYTQIDNAEYNIFKIQTRLINLHTAHITLSLVCTFDTHVPFKPTYMSNLSSSYDSGAQFDMEIAISIDIKCWDSW